MFESLEWRRLFSISFQDGTLTLTGTRGADSISAGFGGFRGDVRMSRVIVNGTSQLFRESSIKRIIVDAGAGDDLVRVEGPACTIIGGGGNDTLSGGVGENFFSGGAGNDQIAIFGHGVIDCGRGDDLVADPLTIFPLPPGTSADVAPIVGPFLVNGGAGDDTLTGSQGNDTIHGNEGNDSIADALGDDMILGDSGNDNIKSYSGNDSLFGGDGDDHLFDLYGVDHFDGGNGHDVINAAGLDDKITGGPGSDHIEPQTPQ
jgi:Ca2+-binding RTX toxin-like protein